MKVAIYTRVSGKSNRQDAANQSLQLVEYCQRQGWDYVEYTDRMSGTRADRAAFVQMFEDARTKRFDIVLFWALDRFSREGTLQTLQYLQRLDSYGVAWKSFTEQYLDSTGMFRDAVIAILATIAKQEHARLSERVVAGLRRAKREGKVLGRKRIILDRERIRTMHAAGQSVRAIAAEVGISKSLVANILANCGSVPARSRRLLTDAGSASLIQ
jgi:DNA invertase Pin-like site-specific DNA recombinase